MSLSKIIIVGGGNAALQAADTLRRSGFEGQLTLFSEEAYLPYQRPPLSKKFLEGKLAQERLFLRPESYYTKRDIDLKLGTHIQKIDRQKQTVTTEHGDIFEYDRLLLATGARLRKFPNHNSQDLGLKYIRGIDDVEAIKTTINQETIRNIAIIGGGFIGLETAATLRTLGNNVTVIEAMSHIMPSLVAPTLASYFKKRHEENNVRILEGVSVQTITKENGQYFLTLENGNKLESDIVIVGIGVIPNTKIAEDAGLTYDKGILVDEYGQTSDQHIFAAGDCANGMHTRFEKHTRLESVQNAVDQATVAAKSMLGEKVPYNALPWFWSDQYDIKLQMAGLSNGYDSYVVRGNMEDNKFSLCYFKENQLIAVDSVNAIPDHMAAKKILSTGIPVTKDQCADYIIPLKNYIQ